MITVAGYSEEQLSPSLKRKHFMLLGNTQQLIAKVLSECGKTIIVYYIQIDHMISGDQLFTDAKLIRRLTKAVGVSDKKMDQLSSVDVSNFLLSILS